MKRICIKVFTSVFSIAAIGACSPQEFQSLKAAESFSTASADPEPKRRICRRPRQVGKTGFLTEGPYDNLPGKVLLNPEGAQVQTLGGLSKTSLTVTINRECQKSPLKSQSRVASLMTTEGPQIESYQLDVDEDEDMNAVLESLESDPCVLYVGDASMMSVYAVDPGLNQQLHMSAIGATSVFSSIYSQDTGVTKDVVVAIIDTGIDSRHPDLAANMWTNDGEIANNGRDDDGNGYADDINGYNFANRNGRQDPVGRNQNHGTHVAGLTGAAYGNGVGGSGVLGQHVKLMGLNVFGSSNGASNSAIENAIRYAADNGADIINMSLGGCGYTPTTGQAISYAIQKGVVIVVAAGNASTPLSANPNDGANCNRQGAPIFDTPGSFGASYTGMLTIGSVEATNISSRSSFSNYGAAVLKLMAPGSESTPQRRGLYSTDVGGGYVRLSGTSMASPVAAGAAAVAVGLLKSRGYSYTPKDIETLLTTSAKTFGSLSQIVSGGRSLDVAKLVQVLDQNYPADTQNPPPVDPPPVDPPPVDPPPVEPPPPVNPTDPDDRRPCRPRRPGRPGRR